MRFLTTSFAILLTLVAFGPTQTMAREPGGGHSGGGQQNAGQRGPGAAETHREVVPNYAGPGDARTNAYQGRNERANPQFSGGVGAAAGPDSWRYRSDNGRWWYWTTDNQWMWYGDDGQWMDYSADAYPAIPYVVARPILADPGANFSGGLIKIVNPAANQQSLSYTLNGNTYTIAPGYSQEFNEDRAWVVQFTRGANSELVQYGLQSGLYSFASTDHGWELFRSELQ